MGQTGRKQDWQAMWLLSTLSVQTRPTVQIQMTSRPSTRCWMGVSHGSRLASAHGANTCPTCMASSRRSHCTKLRDCRSETTAFGIWNRIEFALGSVEVRQGKVDRVFVDSVTFCPVPPTKSPCWVNATRCAALALLTGDRESQHAINQLCLSAWAQTRRRVSKPQAISASRGNAGDLWNYSYYSLLFYCCSFASVAIGEARDAFLGWGNQN